MRQNIRIFFLWLAGLLMMSHGLIPHHHHDFEQDSCLVENETCTSDQYHHIHSIESCCSHSESEPYSVCNLIQKTLVKNQIAVDMVGYIVEQVMVDPSVLTILFHGQPFTSFIQEYFKKTPSRAPPVV